MHHVRKRHLKNQQKYIMQTMSNRETGNKLEYMLCHTLSKHCYRWLLTKRDLRYLTHCNAPAYIKSEIVHQSIIICTNKKDSI
ncbi:hypothetical protein FKM82_006040 [Ascaphus truei]